MFILLYPISPLNFASPLFVTMFTTPDIASPYSALKVPDNKTISDIELLGRKDLKPPKSGSLTDIPSIIYASSPERPPLTCISCPEPRVTPACDARISEIVWSGPFSISLSVITDIFEVRSNSIRGLSPITITSLPISRIVGFRLKLRGVVLSLTTSAPS